MNHFERDQRRERIAMAMLAGILAGKDDVFYDDDKPCETMADNQRVGAQIARGYADALIAELDRTIPTSEALRRLREIEDLVEGEADVEDGVPNLAAKVLVIAKGQDRP